jgi:hypothetical protein
MVSTTFDSTPRVETARCQRSISSNDHSSGRTRQFFSKVCKTLTPRLYPKAETSRSPKSDEEMAESSSTHSHRKKRNGLRRKHRHRKTIIPLSAPPHGLSLSDPTSSSSSYQLSSAEIYGRLIREFSSLRKFLTGSVPEPVEEMAELAFALLTRYRGNEMTVIRFIFDAVKEMPQKHQERLDHLLYLIHSHLEKDPIFSFSLSQPNEPSDPTSFFFLTRYITKELNDAIVNPSRFPGEVAQCIFTLLNNYREQSCTIARFISYSARKLPETDQERLNDILFHLFINPDEVPFFALLWKCIAINHDQTAYSFIHKMLNSSADPSYLSDLIARHTEFELTHQTLQTLFREDNFSSLLCKHYGLHTEQEKLHGFHQSILSSLEALSPEKISQLCFEMRYLRQNSSTSSQLTESENQEMLESLAAANTIHFLAFASKIIEDFYEISLSDSFRHVLTIRRSQIEGFIHHQLTPPISSSSAPSSDLSNLSRIYIGEIIALRIFGAKLFKLARNEREKTIFLSVSKLFQQLSNETELGEQHPSYVRSGFNHFCLEFRARHRKYIDNCSKNVIEPIA